MIGLICGTDLSQFKTFPKFDTHAVDTIYGKPSAQLITSQYKQTKFVFLARHGHDAGIAPHLINYRANIQALADAGVTKIVTLNTVGSTNTDFAPGSWVLPNQLIDYTYGREHTFFDGINQPLRHIDFTQPFSQQLSEQLIATAKEIGFPIKQNACYGCTQGPRLETAAEVQRLKADGNDLIGMTAMPEANLARELDIEYIPMCLVANWGAGIDAPALDIDDIYKLVKKEFSEVLQLALELISSIEQ